MAEDCSYVEENRGERERFRSLVEPLDGDELRAPVNDYFVSPIAARRLPILARQPTVHRQQAVQQGEQVLRGLGKGEID